jgi:hypothetical protein
MASVREGCRGSQRTGVAKNGVAGYITNRFATSHRYRIVVPIQNNNSCPNKER